MVSPPGSTIGAGLAEVVIDATLLLHHYFFITQHVRKSSYGRRFQTHGLNVRSAT